MRSKYIDLDPRGGGKVKADRGGGKERSSTFFLQGGKRETMKRWAVTFVNDMAGGNVRSERLYRKKKIGRELSILGFRTWGGKTKKKSVITPQEKKEKSLTVGAEKKKGKKERAEDSQPLFYLGEKRKKKKGKLSLTPNRKKAMGRKTEGGEKVFP